MSTLAQDVDMVEEYKYLGVHINNGLEDQCCIQVKAAYKNEMSRLCFLRKFRSFNTSSKMLEIFSKSPLVSAVYFAVICWGCRIRPADTNRHNQLIRKDASVTGCKLHTFQTEPTWLENLLHTAKT